MDNKYYASVGIAAANKGVSETTVRKYIQNNTNWRYFDSLNAEEKLKITNLSEATSNSGTFLHGRKVQVKDQIYPSIIQTARAFNIHPRSVRKRILSQTENFKDWKWADD